MSENTNDVVHEGANSIETGAYEIIQSRLEAQKSDLISRLGLLNDERKKVFGGIDFSLITNERISTDNNAVAKDIYSLGDLCILGYNVHLGLRTDIVLEDVFSAYRIRKNRFEPVPLDFLKNEVFIDEFQNLYKYYRNTIFARFYFNENYLYLVFQLSDSPSDIKAFKWLIKEDTTLTYVDSRNASEVIYPKQHEIVWIKATRDMQRGGKHPHVSLANKVFVETTGGDLTIKVEDNTDSGLGIYSEEVKFKDQNLDDAEIHYCDYENLVFIKIKPYQETDRYFIYNHKEQKVFRVDTLKYSARLLPENQGVIFPNGYALQTGDFKVISQDEHNNYNFFRQVNAVDGENFMYIYYDSKQYQYLILSYNIIKQTIETPIVCNGFTVLNNGKLIYLKGDDSATKYHLVHIWQTPFSRKIQINDELRDHKLFKIGNKDLVRAMADCQELIVLLSKQDSYSGLYGDIVKQVTALLDNYYFLHDEEAYQLNKPLLKIRKIAHSAINEFEKVVEIRKNTQLILAKLREKCEKLLFDSKRLNFSQLTEYIDFLADLRTLSGELVGAKDLKYADIPLIEGLETQIADRSTELSNACVTFLLQNDSLAPYNQRVEIIAEEIKNLQKAIDAKTTEKSIDDLAFQLELLVDIVNNLKIEDTSHSTQIIENISVIFARLNQERVELSKKRKNISSKEFSADFQAQITLFEQSVVNFLELANTPLKCDEYLTKLSIHLEELDAKFIDFDEFLNKIGEKREEIYNHFQSKRVALTEARNKRTTSLHQSAERILKGVQNKAESFNSEVEINGYFASDMMIAKVREIAKNLADLEDSAKAEEVITLLKTAQQESIRKLKDRNELYEDGDKIISFGEYKFAVNKQKLDVTLVLKQQQYYYHLTGTSFYEPLDNEVLLPYKPVWDQDYVSENIHVKRFEYLAWQIFSKNQSITTVDATNKQIADYLSSNYGQGFIKGVHDTDALKVIQDLQRLHSQLGLLRYSPNERALAQLFWHYVSEEEKDIYEKLFRIITLLKQSYHSGKQFNHISQKVSEKITEFSQKIPALSTTSLERTVMYLQEEDRKDFTISKEAAELYVAFMKSLKEKGKDLQFISQLLELVDYPSTSFTIVEKGIECFCAESKQNYSLPIKNEAAVFVITQNYNDHQVVSMANELAMKELKSLDTDAVYTLNYNEFTERLIDFSENIAPKFTALQSLKNRLVEDKKKELKLNSFESQVLTSFVRNQLINKVYFPMIGANLSKQIGALGNNKRTDRMGMLLLVSPPGYGKTTLMEYLANRLGLIFMKINGPSLGHDILSTDPVEAKNAGARQELEKLNLALEMGDNVMLYLDDIQHCNPEFLQKFISLADGQRRIEGIFKGEAKTYDLRSKRFCLVMAGNPYTESGEKFKVPDMLANRADIYNLGEITGTNASLFDLSLIENSLMSNEYLNRLTQPDIKNLYSLIDSFKTNEAPLLTGNFSNQEINDFTQVLKRILQIRETVLKVNDLYIKSAAQSDEYRNEPSFKLQGSYRDMSKLVSKIQPILNKNEVTQILLEYYQNESQTLTSGAEANLLKLRELMGLLSDSENKRWNEIKETFQKNKILKGFGADNQMAQVLSLLSQFSDGLKGIEDVIKNSKNQ